MADDSGTGDRTPDPDDATTDDEPAVMEPGPHETTMPENERGVVVRVFWNRRERRPRLPWRLAVAAGLLVFANLLLGSVLVTVLGGLNGVVGQSLFVVTVVVALPTASYLVGRRPIRGLGLDVDGQWLRDAGFGLALGVALPTLLVVVTFLAGWLTITGTFVRDTDAFLSFGGLSTPVALLAVALFFLGVAVSEELLVRGYLLTNLAEALGGFERIGRRWAIVIATLSTAALFGLLHASNPSASALSITNITLFGVLLGLAYVWTDRLGVAIGLHLAWNAVVGAVYGLPVSGITVGVTVLATETTGPALLTGGAFGPEGGLLVLLALVVGTGLTAWWVRRAYGDLALRESVAVPNLRE
jgi:membrane protease YdiL (CAAX protease family)